MFAPSVLNNLANTHRNTLKDLAAVETALNQRFYQMQDAVEAVILAAATGEPLLLVGAPGTAKSRLIRVFCGMVGVLDLNDLSQRNDEKYFEYLLTPFTEPGELFGYYNIALAQDSGRLERDDDNMMQKAQIVYLDEVFNASSAILNTLLTFMNENYFHDRGKRIKVPLECLFGATNHVPDTPELLAVYDRFLLRCWVSYIDPDVEQIAGLLQKSWNTTYGTQATFQARTTLLAKLKEMREDIRQHTTSGNLVLDQSSTFYNQLAVMMNHARSYRLSDVSNRRLIKMVYVMLIHRLYRAAARDESGQLELGQEQSLLFRRFFLDRSDDIQADKLEGSGFVHRI